MNLINFIFLFFGAILLIITGIQHFFSCTEIPVYVAMITIILIILGMSDFEF